MEIRDIPNHFGYGVDANGGTWTKKGAGFKNDPQSSTWKPLKQHIDNKGYAYVNMRSGKHSLKRRPVHQLILEAFIGPRPHKQCCRHLDGNPANNKLSNLKWGTYCENQQDTVRHGTSNRGENSGKAKLTEGDVRIIRRMATNGTSVYAISKTFGVSTWAIRDIVDRKNWAWLEG